jgi:hypothetical protein
MSGKKEETFYDQFVEAASKGATDRLRQLNDGSGPYRLTSVSDGDNRAFKAAVEGGQEGAANYIIRQDTFRATEDLLRLPELRPSTKEQLLVQMAVIRPPPTEGQKNPQPPIKVSASTIETRDLLIRKLEGAFAECGECGGKVSSKI